MKFKFEEIKTAAELMEYISISGMPTDQERIFRMQDIIGHTAVEDLVAIANDIGRNDEHGNPDPNGTWSSGRRGTQGLFYSLIFHIWNWEDATRFWNKYTNPDKKLLTKTYEDLANLKKQNEHLTARRNELLEEVKDATENWKKTYNQFREQEQRAINAEEEIIRLKARLYDLMMKEEERQGKAPVVSDSGEEEVA